jgi:UDP-N-acetylglucosamine 2-epimerase
MPRSPHRANMSDAFFRDLRLPEPAHDLEVGSGTHAEQTGRTMIAYEAVSQRERPAVIVVAGDVNATAACAMLAEGSITGILGRPHRVAGGGKSREIPAGARRSVRLSSVEWRTTLAQVGDSRAER